MIPGLPYRKRAINVLVRGPIAEAEAIDTSYGRAIAQPGDYVVTDPRNGDQWPVKQHLLSAHYEPIDPNADTQLVNKRNHILAKVRDSSLPPNTIAILGTMIGELADIARHQGADTASDQMRASFLAMRDEIDELAKLELLPEPAHRRLNANIHLLLDLFAPASDTRRAVHVPSPAAS